MGIKPTFVQADLDRMLQKEADRIHQMILKAFMYVGELCIIEARTNKTYMDQTGNLTASIGYVLTFNGRIVQAAGFEKDGGNSSAGTGKVTGRNLADSIAKNHTQGYCLAVVAGMNYAFAVEARGKNVLSSAELLAEQILPQLLRDLKLAA